MRALCGAPLVFAFHRELLALLRGTGDRGAAERAFEAPLDKSGLLSWLTFVNQRPKDDGADLDRTFEEMDLDSDGGVSFAELLQEMDTQRFELWRLLAHDGEAASNAVMCPAKFAAPISKQAAGDCASTEDTHACEANAKLQSWADAALRSVYKDRLGFKSHKELQHQEHDDDAEFRKEGGDNRSHTYGECYPETMWQILEAAACVGGCEDGVAKALAKYEFFDLGSGYGKFAMFAALAGMKASTGIELDGKRSHVAEIRKPEFDQQFGCSKLYFFRDSFLTENSSWTQGTAPRILFLDAVCFGKQMPKITSMMAQAAFGADTVVALLGKTMSFGPASGLAVAREPLAVRASWGQTLVHFYRKAPGTSAAVSREVRPSRAPERVSPDGVAQADGNASDLHAEATSFRHWHYPFLAVSTIVVIGAFALIAAWVRIRSDGKSDARP